MSALYQALPVRGSRAGSAGGERGRAADAWASEKKPGRFKSTQPLQRSAAAPRRNAESANPLQGGL